MKLYNEDINEYLDVNIFGECEKSLNKLSEGRIFDIHSNDDGETFFIGEKCDEYFTKTLNVEICKDLSELFSKLANHLELKDK